MTKSQPWIHSWYGDSLGFFLAPFVFLTLGLLKLPPFRAGDGALLETMIFVVLFIDWAHIFAQYFRIYSNPLESPKLKWIYPLSYLFLIPIFAAVVQYSSVVAIDTLLVYFVIFHFIKQQFGFIKIFSHIDGPKTRLTSFMENLFLYLTMATPVLGWHAFGLSYSYKWVDIFFKSPIFKFLFWPVAFLYFGSFIYYVICEYRRTRTNKLFNIPKNLAILSAALGWGAISFLTDSPLLIIFTVTLTHDVSYTLFVWFTGRRDQYLVKKKLRWFSWWSVPGFFIYLTVLILLSDIIMIVHLEMTQDRNWNYWIYGGLFNSITLQKGWLLSLGWSLFFATQAHHYFIDRYLWKKEKDLGYMVKTGKHSLS